MEYFLFISISAAQVNVWTNQDPYLQKINIAFLSGEPMPEEEETAPFKQANLN